MDKKLRSLRMKLAHAEKRALAAAEVKDKADKAWIRAVMAMKRAQSAYAEEATKTVAVAMKKVTNIMSGEEVEIPADTPLCCDPSSETYWSM